jgi:2'-5' RNA ligase
MPSILSQTSRSFIGQSLMSTRDDDQRDEVNDVKIGSSSNDHRNEAKDKNTGSKKKTRQILHHTLTVCMVPDPSYTDVWREVTKARTQMKDPGLYRWPPHANLLYPFVSIKSKDEGSGELVDKDIIRKLRVATEQCSPFSVTLDRLGTFGGGKQGVLWLYPTSYRGQRPSDARVEDYNSGLEPLVQLQALLEEQFPMCSDTNRKETFNPHITVSHFSSLEDAENAKIEIEKWWPRNLLFEVKQIYLLQRKGDDGQFLKLATVGLGESSDVQLHNPPEAFPGMPTQEEDWVREERLALKNRRNRKWRRRGPRGSNSRSTDTPEEVAAKRAARKAKRERLLAIETVQQEATVDIQD